ncbi:MAG: MFS transporter [Acidobacteriota bacterium]|nr:MFS transporter [Acidobacteriota bacterium]
MINYLDRSSLSISLPVIAAEMALKPSSMGVLLSAFFWSYAAMQVPIGWCVDHLDLRWLYVVSFALWSFAQGLTGLAASFSALIAFRVLLGVGESLYLPGATKIVSVFFRTEERSLPCAIFDLGTRAGLVVGGLLTPWLIVRYGWRIMFFIVGFSGLIWLIPWLLTYPRELKVSPGVSVVRHSAAPNPPRLRVTLDRNLVGICLGFFCFDYYWYLLLTWLPEYFVSARHFTIVKAGLFSALPYVFCGLSEVLGGWLGDHLIQRGWNETRTRKGIVTLGFLMGAFLIPAALVKSASLAGLLVIGAGLVGFGASNLLVFPQACAPGREVGVWTGFQNFAGNVGGILAPLLTGFLISETGSYFPAFALGALILAFGLASYWLVVGQLEPLGLRS